MQISVFKDGVLLTTVGSLPEAMDFIKKHAGGTKVQVGAPYGISIDVWCNEIKYRLDNPPSK